jgi:cytochrome c-type biogenesis protein
VIADIVEGVRAWWAPALAFLAGLVSFASPCVLPLVPGYLSFVTGDQAAAGVEGEDGRAVLTRRRIVPIVMFILGFTIVFTVLFGFTASAVSRAIHSSAGQRVAGGFVLAFGAFMLLYALRLGMPWLYREERPLLGRVKPGPAAALPLGMAFAVGWTPCIGPVLGAIVTLAANEGSAHAVLLLLFYSLGLGVPFLLIGLGVGRLMTTFRFFSRHYRWFSGVSGAILVVIGVLLVSGAWTRLTAPLFEVINRFTPAI